MPYRANAQSGADHAEQPADRDSCAAPLSGGLTVAGDPHAELDAAYDRIEGTADRSIWISRFPRRDAHNLVASALARRAEGIAQPLLGMPFAVKDNIDVAGVDTTAGCPDFAYAPARSAFVVERLVAAGAVPVGKTNLDQFATGLNGSRSPYGIPACVFDRQRISGGSSSGSAVAVALGQVPFALGTDTAGSGRVPAAFNNIVGYKPTKGLLSTSGVVPACRSQDCVSLFATTVAGTLLAARVAAGFDPRDPYSRPPPAHALAPTATPRGFRFGTPSHAALADCPPETLRLFEQSAGNLEALGGRRVVIDYEPFQAAAALLYDGPWVAERLAALGGFFARHPASIHPAVRHVIEAGARFSAVDAFQGQYRLAGLVRAADQQWRHMDVMLLPTAPDLPTIEAMLAAPLDLNARLGMFTNFVNLMDLCAFAVPAGFTPDALPFGVTLVGRAFTDGALAWLADRLHRARADATLGASGTLLRTTEPLRATHAPAAGAPGHVQVAVVGAHLTGQPLNSHLTGRGGTLARACRTAPGYSLYALPESRPPKPGLVRDGGEGRIEVEVWTLPVAAFGAIVAEIPPPLGIGTVQLEDGDAVKGFLCEPYAIAGARDITRFGGWRAFLRSTGHAA